MIESKTKPTISKRAATRQDPPAPEGCAPARRDGLSGERGGSAGWPAFEPGSTSLARRGVGPR
jgi:hypothetical protein